MLPYCFGNNAHEWGRWKVKHSFLFEKTKQKVEEKYLWPTLATPSLLKDKYKQEGGEKSKSVKKSIKRCLKISDVELHEIQRFSS